MGPNTAIESGLNARQPWLCNSLERRPSHADWHGTRLAPTQGSLPTARTNHEPGVCHAPELEQLHGRLWAMVGAAALSPLHELRLPPPHGPQLLPQLCNAQGAQCRHAVTSAEHDSVQDRIVLSSRSAQADTVRTESFPPHQMLFACLRPRAQHEVLNAFPCSGKLDSGHA